MQIITMTHRPKPWAEAMAMGPACLMQSRARVNASSFMQGKAKICCIKPPEGACDRPPRLSRPADKNNLSQKIKNRGFC